jgi:chloramphenicol-sensitive protein RarD
MRRGVAAAVTAYTLWGVLPIYWKALKAVPALEILCHRMTWSLVFVVLLMAMRNQWAWLDELRRSRKALLVSLGCAGLLGVNWFTYIWAVNSGHIVDSSLGYFINPLVSVLLGFLFLGERLRSWQVVAIGLAAVGVTFLTVRVGTFPWIAFTLAGTFGLYGLLRKMETLGSLEGLSLEMAFLFLPALAYLVYLDWSGGAAFGHTGPATSLLLAGTGAVTAVPLLLFASGARRVTLATVGILQYIAPTLQFVLGVLAYGEPFDRTRLAGFAIIWVALLVYSTEGIVDEGRRRRRQAGVG